MGVCRTPHRSCYPRRVTVRIVSSSRLMLIGSQGGSVPSRRNGINATHVTASVLLVRVNVYSPASTNGDGNLSVTPGEQPIRVQPSPHALRNSAVNTRDEVSLIPG